MSSNKTSKFCFWLSLLCLCFAHLSAQEVKQNSGSFKRILVFPYPEKEHFSDCDQEIAESSHTSTATIRANFRLNLTRMIAHSMGMYDTVTDFSKMGYEDDLNKVYQSIGFRLVPSPSAQSEEKKDTKLSLKNLLKRKDKKQTSEIKNGDILQNDEKTQFYQAYLRNPNLTPYLKEKYQADRWVMLSMFEIKTRYEICLDREAGNFARDFGIHYSVFDGDGKYLTGDIIRVRYDSNSNQLMMLMKENLPILARRVIENLP